MLWNGVLTASAFGSSRALPFPLILARGTRQIPPLGNSARRLPKTDCSISDHFRNQSIIANIDLCGQWAGQALYYTQQAGCLGTCSNLVATSAIAFEDAYWEFKSFKVYGVS
jgi:hypothetical protein